MTRARWAAAIAAVAGIPCLAACATLLGYDDLDARGAPDAAPTADVPEETESATPDVPEIPVRPPGRPAGAPTPSGKGRTLWLIAKRWYLNTQSLAGLPSKDAWRDIGFDLDHVCTGPAESIANLGTCKRSAKAKPLTLLDGNGCRDNNFGSQIIPLLTVVNSVFETDGNDAIANGRSTWILALSDLDDGIDDPYVPASLYKAANWADFGTTKPKFDGTDVREIEWGSVIDGDQERPRTRFPNGYVRNNVWVSGEPGDFQVIVPFVGIAYDVPISAGVVTVQLSDDHRSAGLSVLGGAIAEKDIERVVSPIASAAGVCPDSPLYRNIVDQVASFVDMVPGAKNASDPTVSCTGISLGCAMQFVSIQPVTRVVKDYTTTDKCTDAGPGDAGAEGGPPDAGSDAAAPEGGVPDGPTGDTKEVG